MALTLELHLNIDADAQTRLQARARQQGLSLQEYLQVVIERLITPIDATTLRKLPREERNRILAAQAEDAAALYAADLARPVEDRELTAFTSLDGEPVYDQHP